MASSSTRTAGGLSRSDAYRRRSTDVGLELTRTLCATLAVLALLAAPGLSSSMRQGALLAHALVLFGSVAVLLLLPAAVRRGQAPLLAAASTAGTIALFVGYSAAWHDVPHAGSVLGVLALVEAPIRYGVRGLPVSAVPVTVAATAWPQQDHHHRRLGAPAQVLLVVLLCAVVLVVRETVRRSARALASAAEGYAEATAHLPLGVAVLDEQGRVLQANPALAALLGPALVGRPLLEHLCRDDDDAATVAAVAELLRGGSPDTRLECWTARGRHVQVGASALRLAGPPLTAVHVQDITAEPRERAELRHASRHDALTGLLVRSAGEELLAQALAGGGRTAVLFLDLDGFKRLNDTTGHAVGDAVLRQAAARLTGALRPAERAVRWGGDEFVVVCRDVDDQQSLAVVAERMLRVLREPFRVEGLPLLSLSASLGAVLASTGQDPTQVLAAADRAMYTAKSRGGDCWVGAADMGPAPAPAPAPRMPSQR